MTRIKLWCRCGGSLDVRSSSTTTAVNIGVIFRQCHVDAGCSITDDPALGRMLLRKARQRSA